METDNILFEFDGIRIQVADKRNLEIRQYREVKDKKTKEVSWQWVWVGYYSNLRDALMAMAEMSVKESKTLRMAMDKLDELWERIEAFSGKGGTEYDK